MCAESACEGSLAFKCSYVVVVVAASQLAEQEGAKLKFPEYVDFSRDLSKINNFRISVLLPMGASEGFRSITISCGPVDSVQQLIEQTFSKFHIRENRCAACFDAHHKRFVCGLTSRFGVIVAQRA